MSQTINPVAGNQSYTGVVNHASQVQSLDVADLLAAKADIEELTIDTLSVDDLVVSGDATFNGKSAKFSASTAVEMDGDVTVNGNSTFNGKLAGFSASTDVAVNGALNVTGSTTFQCPTLTVNEGTGVLLNSATSLGITGSLNVVAAGPHIIKWTPGPIGTNSFDPPVQAVSDATFANVVLDRTSDAALIATDASATNRMPADNITSQVPGTGAVVFEVDSSAQTLYVTVPGKTPNTVFDVTSFATAVRTASGNASFNITLEGTPGTGVTGSLPTQVKSTTGDGSWTLQTSGTLTIAAPTGAKQSLLESVIKASPPSPWIQGPNACVVSTQSHMNVQQTA